MNGAEEREMAQRIADLEAEEELRQIDTAQEAQRKGFIAVFGGNDSGPNVGLRKDGTLDHTSCDGWNEAEGKKFLRRKIEEAIEKLGQGPVRFKYRVTNGVFRSIWNETLEGGSRALVDKTKELGGDYFEGEVDDIYSLAEMISTSSSDAEEWCGVWREAQLLVALKYAYKGARSESQPGNPEKVSSAREWFEKEVGLDIQLTDFELCDLFGRYTGENIPDGLPAEIVRVGAGEEFEARQSKSWTRDNRWWCRWKSFGLKALINRVGNPLDVGQDRHTIKPHSPGVFHSAGGGANTIYIVG